MKNDLTTGAWQDDIWCPINIILFCTSDGGRNGRGRRSGGRWHKERRGADNARQSGGGGRNKRGGRWCVAIGWWITQRDERDRLRGPNAVADDTTRGALDNTRHVACIDLPPCMMDIILDNSVPLFILHLKLELLPPLGANIVTHHCASQLLITGYEVCLWVGSCCLSDEPQQGII